MEACYTSECAQVGGSSRSFHPSCSLISWSNWLQVGCSLSGALGSSATIVCSDGWIPIHQHVGDLVRHEIGAMPY